MSESGHFWPGPRRLRIGRVRGTRGSILSEPGAQSLKYVKVIGSEAYMEASFDHQYLNQVTKIVLIPLTYNNDSSKDDSRPEVDGQVIAGE